MYEDINKHIILLLQVILFKLNENYRSCHILSKHIALLRKLQVFIYTEKVKEYVHIIVYFAAKIKFKKNQ
jgi:hypothetical protein